MKITKDVTFTIPVEVEVPKGQTVCPFCFGKGEIRVGYDGGHDRDYWKCTLCLGTGFVEKSLATTVNYNPDKHERPEIFTKCMRCGHPLIEHRKDAHSKTDFKCTKCECKHFRVSVLRRRKVKKVA